MVIIIVKLAPVGTSSWESKGTSPLMPPPLQEIAGLNERD